MRRRARTRSCARSSSRRARRWRAVRRAAPSSPRCRSTCWPSRRPRHTAGVAPSTATRTRGQARRRWWWLEQRLPQLAPRLMRAPQVAHLLLLRQQWRRQQLGARRQTLQGWAAAQPLGGHRWRCLGRQVRSLLVKAGSRVVWTRRGRRVAVLDPQSAPRGLQSAAQQVAVRPAPSCLQHPGCCSLATRRKGRPQALMLQGVARVRRVHAGDEGRQCRWELCVTKHLGGCATGSAQRV
mmetsp:Transcript_20835/g.52985  ORF Transcript_20835/g.52985 Transcript_20835/m.52985 type:complete len:238 (+) Transcript_20835:154-867(+)